MHALGVGVFYSNVNIVSVFCSSKELQYLHSTTGQCRLSGLALMHLNHGVNIDLDGGVNILQ